MKKISLASMALAALMVSPAFAADLPRKAPPPVVVPAPVYTWTGCYIGANIGWVKAERSVEIYDEEVFSRSVNGGAFGGQIGCDYQFATNWVIGIRGLLDGTNIDLDRHTRFEHLSFNAELSRFATITARLGYAVTPAFLIYGQVGWGTYKTNLVAYDPTNNNLWWGHASKSHSGLDLGIGAEWMFAPNWSLWIEWDHIFGDDHEVFFPRLERTARVKGELDKVLIGVNWRFGGVGGPLRAAY